MCGITGYWNLRSGEPIDTGRLERMNDVMEPRGPDDAGVFIDGSFGMAARRLSIIDIEGGHQPIGTENGRHWIAYNGEVYNFPDIRDRLISKGHRFQNRTDTETVLHLIEDVGIDALSELNGMFAFAVFDREERTLLLARDRLGIKPLFYAFHRGRLVFGSDLKSFLLAGDGLTDELDHEAIHHYLSLNYIPAPHSVFRHVKSLPPGHALTLDSEGRLNVISYWDLSYSTNDRPEEVLIEELRELLRDSVKMRLLSDVPVGVLLSGGVDSSAIAAFMSAEREEPIKTFSANFAEGSFSEVRYARQISQRFGTDHYEVVVGSPDEGFIQQLAWDLGQPYADSSMVPLRAVCRLAREQVKVVLSGDGGDEVFSGYQTYTAFRLASHYRKLPHLVTERVIRPLVEKLPVSDDKISFEYKAKRFVRAASLPPEVAHYQFKVLFDETEKGRLFRPAANGRRPRDSYAVFDEVYRSGVDGGDTLNRLLYVDTKIYLPDNILVKVDRMSMANSLEARVPLLDHRIVEFAAALPTSFKQSAREGKVLFKRALRGLVPDRVLGRKKEGFNVPASRWLKGPLSEMVEDYLSPAEVGVGGLFDAAEVRRVIDDHDRGVDDRSREIYGLLMFQIWHRHVYRGLRADPSFTAPEGKVASPTRADEGWGS